MQENFGAREAKEIRNENRKGESPSWGDRGTNEKYRPKGYLPVFVFSWIFAKDCGKQLNRLELIGVIEFSHDNRKQIHNHQGRYNHL